MTHNTQEKNAQECPKMVGTHEVYASLNGSTNPTKSILQKNG